MSYASIMVATDDGRHAAQRVRLAADLAHRFGARLVGAAACMPDYPQAYGETAVPMGMVLEEIRQAARTKLVGAEQTFRNASGGGERTEWRSDIAGPVPFLATQSRAADLVVVGRRGAEDADPGPLGVPPGPVLMEAGRPVLVVPPRLAGLKGTRVVVAWKDGPAARRAVSAALPFLREADHVLVVSVGPDAHREGAEDVAGHLARHGAQVTTHLLRTAMRESDEILDFALRQEADLVVMGAYGRSRLREWIFGGVTRDLLDRSTLCCLMSH